MNSLKLPWKGIDWKKTKDLFVRDGKIEDGVSSGQQPNFLGHSLIVATILILIGGSFISLKSFAETKEKEWFGLIEREELSESIPDLDKQEPAVNRIKEQFDDIQDRIERHGDVMLYFHRQYFVCLSMSWGLSIVAAICATLVSRDGWKKANNGLISTFIVVSCFVVVYKQIPEIFEQKLNLGSNLDLYLKYIELGDKIQNYLATGGIVIKKEGEPDQFVEISANEFVYKIDEELALLNSIPLNFDATQILEVSDIIKRLNADGMSNNSENSNKPDPEISPSPSSNGQ